MSDCNDIVLREFRLLACYIPLSSTGDVAVLAVSHINYSRQKLNIINFITGGEAIHLMRKITRCSDRAIRKETSLDLRFSYVIKDVDSFVNIYLTIDELGGYNHVEFTGDHAFYVFNKLTNLTFKDLENGRL